MKKYYLPAAILIASLVFLGIGVWPAFTNYQEGNKLLAEKQKEQNKLSAKLDSLKAINQFQQDSDLQFSLQSLPVIAPYQHILTLLDELSTQQSVTVSDLEINSTKDAVLLKFTVSADLPKLQDFLGIINHSLPVSATNKIELSKSQSQSTSTSSAQPALSYTAKLELNYQYKPAPKTIGKASDPLPAITGDLQKVVAQLREFTNLASKAPLTPQDISAERAQKLFPE